MFLRSLSNVMISTLYLKNHSDATNKSLLLSLNVDTEVLMCACDGLMNSINKILHLFSKIC
jgi:hypothetical protein